jgi:hypothetical protein
MLIESFIEYYSLRLFERGVTIFKFFLPVLIFSLVLSFSICPPNPPQVGRDGQDKRTFELNTNVVFQKYVKYIIHIVSPTIHRGENWSL